MTEAQGIPLGRHYDGVRHEVGGPLDYPGERHVIVFGPNGSGKGTRFLVPTLLTLKDRSVLVIDPKGELAAITADYRRSLGEVVILNPFNVLGLGSDGFNPLAMLDAESPLFYDDAAALGEALIRVEGKDPHWGESAQGLVVGLLMWEKLRKKEAATLGNVRAMLTEPDVFESYLDEKDEVQRQQTKGLRITAADMIAEGGPIIESLASRFTERSNELASIRSTADTQTRWMLSPPMAADLGKNGIDFRRLTDHGPTDFDLAVRQAKGQYVNPEFHALTGLSGAPVFDISTKRLCGMVNRGGMRGDEANLYFIDIVDVLAALRAVADGVPYTRYNKTVARLRPAPPVP